MLPKSNRTREWKDAKRAELYELADRIGDLPGGMMAGPLTDEEWARVKWPCCVCGQPCERDYCGTEDGRFCHMACVTEFRVAPEFKRGDR